MDQPSFTSAASPKKRKTATKRADEEINAKIQSVLNSLEKGDDQDTLFGQYIAGELKQITDPRVKLNLKMTINNEVAKARLALLSGVNES